MAAERIQLPQSTETDVQEVAGADWTYHYGYSRSAESREGGDNGQDYVTLLEEGDRLLFVVCDGISMSYYGDFAARFLGNALLDWLNSLHCVERSEADLQQDLEQFLIGQARKATLALREHVIPAHIKGVLREVLLAKKEKGSAAVYGCGRLDRPGPAFPDGRLVLAWQGDVRMRLWHDQDECTSRLGDRFHTRHQWNSVEGPVGGAPHVICEALNNRASSGGLLLHSDGLKTLDGIPAMTREVLSAAQRCEAQHPSSDDMSLFHVRWAFPPAAT